jgi:hypothetical protein
LSEAAPREVEPTELPAAQPLSDDEVQAVLARVPALPADPDAVREFAFPEAVVPPPRTGVTVQAEFPPVEERERPEDVATGPLEVVRLGPEGELERARDISVTFSQPMVPVTSHQELAARDIPARLTPQPDGRWRWVGTKTLLFEVDAGLPMATDYRVEVPAGVESPSGNALAEAVAWTFRTPPPKLVRSYPQGESVTEDPMLFVAFDQRIDPDAVLDHIRVTARRREVELRRATEEEIAGDDYVERITKSTPEGRWLAFKATTPLPRNSPVQVVVEQGTPSAEGPLTTQSDQSYGFRTHGPLRVTDSRCGWYEGCFPGDRWSIGFSNPLDAEAYDASWVSVEPEMVGVRVSVGGDRLSISGRSQPRTKYRVRLSAAIKDVFGRTLEKRETVEFDVDSVPAMLSSRGPQLVLLDPLGPREFTVRSINHKELVVRIYRVQPNDWPAFAEGLERYRYDDEPWQPPGQLVFSESVPVDAEPDTWALTAIDLSPALTDGLGHAVLVVEPTDQPEERYRRQVVYHWVQATHLGLSAVADAEDVLGWVTSLDDGAPHARAELEVVPGSATTTTDADGLGTILLPPRSRDERAILIARRDGDAVFLPLSLWGVGAQNDVLDWYVMTDRPLYRPGEQVHAKGWLRKIGAGVRGDVELPAGAGRVLNWSVSDGRGNDIADGRARLNDLAGFDLSFELPEDVALGGAYLEVIARSARRTDGNSHTHVFQVQEFRRPEYEVTASHDAGPHIVGDAATVSVAAKYFAGGGLPEAEVSWVLESGPAYYTPPNWHEFTFGRAWDYRQPHTAQEYESRTDYEGNHRLRIDLLEADPPVTMSLSAAAAVQDVNRQTWTGRGRHRRTWSSIRRRSPWGSGAPAPS